MGIMSIFGWDFIVTIDPAVTIENYRNNVHTNLPTYLPMYLPTYLPTYLQTHIYININIIEKQSSKLSVINISQF